MLLNEEYPDGLPRVIGVLPEIQGSLTGRRRLS